MVEIVNEVGVTLINASASDEMVAMAAWVSHDADSEDRLKNEEQVKKLIGFLYKNKHMSPFEHGHFTFKIDAPLFVAREFLRHRTASYNEVSGRYTEMKPRFYSGTVAREQHGKPGDYFFEDGTNEQTAIYLQTKRKDVKRAWKTYQQRLEAGIAKEQAREELPLSLMTQFYVTMNPRNLMQFLTLRNEKHALKEIQDVAVQMEKIFHTYMPLTYDAYKTQRDAEVVDYKRLYSELVKEHATALTRIKTLEGLMLVNPNANPKTDPTASGGRMNDDMSQYVASNQDNGPSYNIYLSSPHEYSIDKIKEVFARINKERT